MSFDMTSLKSVAVLATRRMLVDFDKSPVDISSFAMTIPSLGRQRTQKIEWINALPVMREWIGDRKTSGLFKNAIEMTLKMFEMTFKLDLKEVELDGDRSFITTAEQVAGYMVAGWANGKAVHAYEPMRSNATTTYDDQNLFDTDHVDGDGTTFSNVVDLSTEGYSRATSGKPTILEARQELRLAVDRLQRNRLRYVTIIKTSAAPLTVFTKSFDTYRAYWDLLTQPTIPDGAGAVISNDWAGKFELYRDLSPVSGDEKKIDVIDATPGGPRPVFFMSQKEPGALEVDTTEYFKTKEVYYGTDGIFSFAAGLPHAAVRIQE